MKTNNITKRQKEIIDNHLHISNHFKVDKDGKTVYARLRKGYIKVPVTK